MQWTVRFTNRAAKQIEKLNYHTVEALRFLVNNLQANGPAPGKGWHHYGKLRATKKEDRRHCHLNQGRPVYVCCWAVIDKKLKILEVYYVGTHEKAPY